MNDEFLTFQKFNDLTIAREIGAKLGENDIAYLLETNDKYFDVSFANNAGLYSINLKIKAQDFIKANHAIDEYYQADLDNVDKDYYLLAFSNEELTDIISKPDEWGHFDYLLARKILADRGIEIAAEKLELLKTNRLDDLAKPEKTNLFWIIVGYIYAVLGGYFGLLGGFLGIFIGWALAYLKKTLPDGSRVFIYTEAQRKHGRWILIISTISTACWLIFRFSLFGRR
ncbi:MAG: hypothetical protein ABIQ31_26565 [Ferruginibacter sp.]